jgi:hypothetical protein
VNCGTIVNGPLIVAVRSEEFVGPRFRDQPRKTNPGNGIAFSVKGPAGEKKTALLQ